MNKLGDIYPRPDTILRAIKATEDAIIKRHSDEHHAVQEARLNKLRRAYIKSVDK